MILQIQTMYLKYHYNLQKSITYIGSYFKVSITQISRQGTLIKFQEIKSSND